MRKDFLCSLLEKGNVEGIAYNEVRTGGTVKLMVFV